MKVTTIGIDLAKNVFQIHRADERGKGVLRKQLKRKDVVAFFARPEPCLIGMEAFATGARWRAAYMGVVPSPYASGESETEQGISKAGNRPVRTFMVELAWSWLRHQPESQLSRWFARRFAGGGKRLRRIGIVALARRLPSISRYPVPKLEDLPEDIRARILEVHENAGSIPNVFLTPAQCPEEFRAFLTSY